MFDVIRHKTIIKDMHKIVSNYIVLLHDGDNAAIYSGNNQYGNRILGVIMFEDDDEGYLRYMHVLLTDGQYTDYIHKKITLRQIIETNESLFLVDKGYTGIEKSHNLVYIRDIPDEFLPLHNSYCPEFIKDSSFSYAVGLKGKKADEHLTSPEDLNNVNTHITGFLRAATEFLHDLQLQRQVYVEALPTGSFRIKFRIEVAREQSNPLFAVPVEKVSAFLNDYLSYLLEKLPNEIGDFKSEKVSSPDFEKIERAFTELYNMNGAMPVGGVEEKLVTSMAYSVDNLREIDYNNSFDRIELINYSNTGEEIPVGMIDEAYLSSVEDKFFRIEQLADIVEYDQSPQKYRIQVYSLNKESGNGLAYLQLDESIFRISLYLRGRNDYQNTLFTRNMDEKERKLIEIEAIAKRVNGNIKAITYTFVD